MIRMIRFAALLMVLLVLLVPYDAARAQDVQGIELCTHETRMDRRTGCLQSNIEYLHQLIAKNAAAAQQKLTAAAAELDAMKGEVAALKAALAGLQARLDKLETAAKSRPAPAAVPLDKAKH